MDKLAADDDEGPQEAAEEQLEDALAAREAEAAAASGKVMAWPSPNCTNKTIKAQCVSC